MKTTRRGFLGLAGAGLLAAAGRSEAKPPSQTGLDAPLAPLKLPPWKYGASSTSTETVLMFRGNPSHTFYGTGPIPDRPRLLWSYRMEAFRTELHGKPKTWAGTGWTGQATKLGDTVFVGAVDRSLYAFDAKAGKLAWRYRASRMFKSSNCIFENRLYIGNVDNFLRCIDCATGQTVWKLDTTKDLDSSPCVVDGKLYVTGESGNAWCIDPRTGKPIWKTFIGGVGPGSLVGSNGSETSPAIADGELYAATYDGELICIDIATGKIRWKANTGDDTDASPVVHGDHVWIASEEGAPYVYCFARKDGRLVWKFDYGKGSADAVPPPKASRSRTNGTDTYGGAGYWSTPAVKDGRLYIGAQKPVFLCLDAKSGKLIWQFKTGSNIWSSPCVVDDKVIFACSDRNLYILDAKTGRETWRYDLRGHCISTPCVVGGQIFIGSAAGTFFAFGA